MSGEVDVVKVAVANFESTNGARLKDINTKQLVLILHKELSDKIESHIRWGEKEDRKLIKALNDHDILFQKIVDVLPERGFCEKVDKTLYTAKGEDKVELLWNDRRWIKYLAVVGFGAIITGIGMIGVSLIT